MLGNLIVLLIVGGVVGWLASLIMHTDAQQGILLNIIIGIVGAFIASWLFGTVLGYGGAFNAGTFSIRGFLWALIGSIVLILVLKVLRVLR